MVKRPSPLDIYKLLDKSNCGACGANTCMEFVTDLLERRKKLEQCPPEHLPDKKRKKIIELITPPQLPVEFGVGPRMAIIGGEEAYHRHDLTFFNETAIAMEVSDSSPTLLEEVKYITEFNFMRIGDDLRYNAIAIRCTTDPDTYAKKVKEVSDNTDLPLILCSFDPQALQKAAEVVADKKPLLYAATKENWKEVGAIAFQYNLPVVCFSLDLDELVSIGKSLEEMGVKELVFDPGTVFGEGYSTATMDRVMRIRTSSIRDGSPLTKWPVMGVPATVWVTDKPEDEDDIFMVQYKEALAGISLMSIDVNLLIMHTGKSVDEIHVPMVLMTYRQNIFTDPRIYPRVDPGLYKIGEPGDMAPVFVTSNYRMTKIPVEQDIKDARIDAWLLVVDTDGLGIEAGVAGGQMTADKIAEWVNSTKVFDKVKHRILVFPGMAARLSGATEDEANCYVSVGPKDSSGIQRYMETDWKPEEFMKEYLERIS
ncbi:MAG: acetyl-CoA decarbonylase/synthase complex subunit gamma [Promethearchaeota archaeon]